MIQCKLLKLSSACRAAAFGRYKYGEGTVATTFLIKLSPLHPIISICMVSGSQQQMFFLFFFFSFLFAFVAFFNLWLASKTSSPVDKSACEQSHADQLLRHTAAWNQSNSRQNFLHCPIRQQDLKLTLEAIVAWNSLGGSEIGCDSECSVTQFMLQYEMDASVPSLQVTAWPCRCPEMAPDSIGFHNKNQRWVNISQIMMEVSVWHPWSSQNFGPIKLSDVLKANQTVAHTTKYHMWMKTQLWEKNG